MMNNPPYSHEKHLKVLEKALIATNKKIYDKQQKLIKCGIKETA